MYHESKSGYLTFEQIHQPIIYIMVSLKAPHPFSMVVNGW